MNILIIKICIHISPFGTKLECHHLYEIATINYQGYHTVVHSSNTCNYQGMYRNDTATSHHNDKVVTKKSVRDEVDNCEINLR